MQSKAAPFAVAIAVFATNSWWTTVDLLFSGKLQQFPNLKFSLAEGGIGWVPYMLERTDFTWGAPPVLPGHRLRRPAFGAVPRALLDLFHRR